MKQNNNKDTALQRTVQWVTTLRLRSVTAHCLPPLSKGMLFAIGFFGTTILAVAISGTIKTWTTGEVLKSSDLNSTINSFKTAIEGIPNWTKASNGNDAYYTSGNVGIGTTSPSAPLSVVNNGGSSTSPQINFETYSSSFRTLLQLRRSRGTSTAPSLIQSGDELGRLYFQGFDGSTFSNGAAISASVDSTPGASDMPSALIFYTTPDGSNSITERMRITNAGNVGIGTNSPTAMLHINGTAGNNTGTFSNLSDQRVKKNIQSLENPLEKVLRLRPVSFEWKDTSTRNVKSGTHMGFVAQEVEKVFPEWVDQMSDGYKWLTPEGITSVTIGAIQQLKKDHDLVKDENKNLLEENRNLREEIKDLQYSVNKNSQITIRLEERLRVIENLEKPKK